MMTDGVTGSDLRRKLRVVWAAITLSLAFTVIAFGLVVGLVEKDATKRDNNQAEKIVEVCEASNARWTRFGDWIKTLPPLSPDWQTRVDALLAVTVPVNCRVR